MKFARDCQHCLPNLLQELSNKLGEATRDLAVRVGLHSGTVTAGVLRGDKVRFELFGDTVNTVSEMSGCARVLCKPLKRNCSIPMSIIVFLTDFFFMHMKKGIKDGIEWEAQSNTYF